MLHASQNARTHNTCVRLCWAPLPDPGHLDDLFSFNIATMTWTLLSAANGIRPAARCGHGFASAGGKLYVHGGESPQTDGNLCETDTLLVCESVRVSAWRGCGIGRDDASR